MLPENAQLEFTVAICTYNGASRIPDVLECLRWQLKTENIQWEVIVVDNNSNDGTADIIQRYQKDWPYPGRLHYAFEPKQGAGYARQKAVSMARSPWIGFVDDDNLLSMVWVHEACQFARRHPRVGVFGSRIRGLFECDTPDNFERIAPFLAITDRGYTPLIYAPEKKVLPPGAGMVVRRDAWVQNVPDNPVLSGRAGGRMLTGEDLEAVLHIQRAGWEVWYNPAMQLDHKIPQHRLTRQYLISLMRGIGLSRHRTRMLSVPGWKRPAMFWVYGLNDIRKIMFHVVKHGSKFWTDTVAASELTIYCCSLVSPYYLWQQKLRQQWSNCFHQVSATVMSTDS
ncbi:MAG: glycosyltransferase family 2 protein [Leptolyngbya sp. SIO1E4]|nr:glycosyltransferase family 2 protein [Leptolyngbya sp. SIO1E4]